MSKLDGFAIFDDTATFLCTNLRVHDLKKSKNENKKLRDRSVCVCERGRNDGGNTKLPIVFEFVQ